MTINHPRKETHLDSHLRLPYDGVETNPLQVFPHPGEKGQVFSGKENLSKKGFDEHTQADRWSLGGECRRRIP